MLCLPDARRRAPCIAGAIAIGCALAAPALAAPDAAPASVPARAAPTQPPILVLEAHVGTRPSELDATVGPVLDELEQRGFAARPASITRVLGGRAPRPGVLDGGKTAAEITQLVESGFDAFTRGKYKEAETSLDLAVHQIKRNPALLALDAGNARSTFHAFVGLALSQAKLGNAADSVETMTELLRSFSTQTISRAEYGPQAEQFYRAVQKQTQLMGRGRLTVAAGDDHAMIFVDGELRGMGKAAMADLIPGAYRVFIEVPGTPGRQYEVEVRANADSRLDVDWQVDASLLVSSQWVGFVFASEVERSNEASYAGALARRWGGDRIVTVGTTRLQGRPAVIATLYRTSGEVERSALVVTGGGGDARLRSLARFIADGTPSDELARVTGVQSQRTAETAPSAPHGSMPLGAQLCLGAGIAGLATGAALVIASPGPDPKQRYYYRTAPAGIAVGLTGAASIGLGLWWWWLRGHAERSAPAVSLGASHAAIGWSGQF
ncbi:MAG TPA: hypothetical protein VHT91_06255 [Kofleriaceae bacterium]|jgi:hypothetical protein|nr:hypothetical protein [Kofleriaceae bacterium]